MNVEMHDVLGDDTFLFGLHADESPKRKETGMIPIRLSALSVLHRVLDFRFVTGLTVCEVYERLLHTRYWCGG